MVQSEARQKEPNGKQIMFLGQAAVLAIGLMLLSRNIDRWFVGWQENTSAIYSLFARNHIYYGPCYTKLFHTYDSTEAPPAQPHRYLNTPPLLSVWAAIPMLVFGDHEWAGRSVAIAATLGSAWLLMVIVGRLQSPLLGLISGFFYVMLPITAYFGRVLEYTSATQFFSLLMLHGYLQWTGLYGSGYGRKAGAVYYVLGVVLGTGTGWAAVIMAGLIWLWHLWQAFRNRLSRRLLFWLTIIPAVSLIAVITHIAWGCNWNIKWLFYLFLSRTAGKTGGSTHIGLSYLPTREWFFWNWVYLAGNVSIFGVGAAVLYPAITAAILRYTAQGSPFRQIVSSKASVVPVFLTLIQGLVWVFIFQERYQHDYWQYFMAPYFAAAMGTVILTVITVFRNTLWWLALLLILLPVPSFAKSLDMFHVHLPINQEYVQYLNDTIVVFKKLNQYVRPRVPVMVSEKRYESSEMLGDYKNYTPHPQTTYYANRPLIQTTDVNEIEANSRNCAAYILRATDDPNMYKLAQKLAEKYKVVIAEQNYIIFLLNPHPADEQVLPK
jgi:hypothetical protein